MILFKKRAEKKENKKPSGVLVQFSDKVTARVISREEDKNSEEKGGGKT